MRRSRARTAVTCLCLAAALLLALAVANWLFAAHLAFTMGTVENVTEPAAFRQRFLPGAIHQSLHSRALQEFRQQMPHAMNTEPTELSKAVSVRQWCRLQQTGEWNDNDDTTDNPHTLLARQRSGRPGACRRFAYVFAGALLAEHLDSRVVNVSSGVHDYDANHTLVEVWIDELHTWVLMDSMFNAMFRVDGRPASLIDVYEAVADDPARVRVDRGGATSEPTPRFDAAHIGMFRHIFVSMHNGLFDDADRWHSSRRFVHYARQGIGPYPEGAKRRAMALAMAAAFGAGCCLLVIAAIGAGGVPRRAPSAARMPA